MSHFLIMVRNVKWDNFYPYLLGNNLQINIARFARNVVNNETLFRDFRTLCRRKVKYPIDGICKNVD